MIKVWALKIGIVLALLIAVVTGTWFAADAHYSKQYTSLEAQLRQEAKDQEVENAKTLARYATAAQEINDETQTKLAGANDHVARLVRESRDRANQVSVCPATPGQLAAANAANGPAVAGSDQSATVALEAATLRSALEVGIDALNAELLWRKWAAETR